MKEKRAGASADDFYDSPGIMNKAKSVYVKEQRI